MRVDSKYFNNFRVLQVVAAAMSVVLILGYLIGCRTGAGNHSLQNITVNVQADGSDVLKLRSWVRQVLDATSTDENLKGTVVLDLDLRAPKAMVPIRRDGVLLDRTQELVIRGTLAWRRQSSSCLVDKSVIFSSRAPGPLEHKIEKMVYRSVAECLRSLAGSSKVLGMNEAELVRRLPTMDGQELDLALKKIVDRRMTGAAPALVHMFRATGDEKLKKRLLGVFARLRARGAVDDIIAWARSKDSDELVPVLAVLAQISGPKAEAFLQWAAHFHGDAHVREEAAKLLDRIQMETPRQPVPVRGQPPAGHERKERQPPDILPGEGHRRLDIRGG